MMASACVNNVGTSPENFTDCIPTYPSHGWLSPRISFSRDLADEESKIAGGKSPFPVEKPGNLIFKSDLDFSSNNMGDFEFRLEDPVTMLHADELFSDGKLVPLQIPVICPEVASTKFSKIRSPETEKLHRVAEVSVTDSYLFSPKAPRCSSRWKELLGLKKLHQNSNQDASKSVSLPNKNPNPKSLKHFLHRHSKTSSDPSLSLPLLRDTDCESVSSSSHLSLCSSSSSSSPDDEDLSRLSLHSEKPNPHHISRNKNLPRVKVVKQRAIYENPRTFVDNSTARIGRSRMRRAPDSTATIPARGVSVDSPRMNSCGKIVFQNLERSSSSPSSFNGGPRFKQRGMERSYSANVRVTPVLNVPVCSLRGSSKSGGSVFGFSQLFSSPQRRDGLATRAQQKNRIRSDRI
ncbi:hypothetical protein HHK36_003199 [Tetracentron sinense]|uniref:Uncharacterized protein n=1 Tax=Tetracentron sinense TaxID=13715 RepID=A0A834ZQQ7_TETSI|nr:hypothetical protein HHK36_003199 [Tetracentron sinense]